MKVLIVLNEAYLTSEEIEKISPDKLFCLFSKRDMFKENDMHFYLKNMLINSNKLLNSILEKYRNAEYLIFGKRKDSNHIKMQIIDFGAVAKVVTREHSTINLHNMISK